MADDVTKKTKRSFPASSEVKWLETYQKKEKNMKKGLEMLSGRAILVVYRNILSP
jgi:hypothetical protein